VKLILIGRLHRIPDKVPTAVRTGLCKPQKGPLAEDWWLREAKTWHLGRAEQIHRALIGMYPGALQKDFQIPLDQIARITSRH
jgi:hypothetical protein